MAADRSFAEVADHRPWVLKNLPPFPPVALQLLSLLDNPDVPLKKIVALLRLDPALSAELLRVANSALYGFVQQIDTVNHAVIVLGSENVKRLALTVALSRFAAEFLRQDKLHACWDHVIASAALAEALAVEVGVSKERGYTAALLHDIGRLALLACHPAEYASLLAAAQEQDFDELDGERRLFDIDHCTAGAWLARRWSLPADVAAAIALHHQQGPVEGELTPLVRSACRAADCLGFSALPVSRRRTVREALEGLALKNPDRTAADIEASGELIQRAIAAVGLPGRPGRA